MLTRFSLRLPDDVHAEARALAAREGMSLNDWIVAAVDRENVRQRLVAHNDWVRHNPLYTEARWLAEQQDIVEAAGEAKQRP